MYKVMIVDDEVLVRVGLKSTIDWEDLGFAVVAEASNGEQAYEAYLKHKPDVILTDIKMPKQDGLWLTKKIRQENQQVKILMLTCYNDFAYAREALKSGADDYILKSEAEDEELIRIMTGIKESLDSELGEYEKRHRLKMQMDTNLSTLKGKLLEDLLKVDRETIETVILRCSQLGFPLEGSRFAFVAFFRDDAERKADFPDLEWQNMNNAIVNIVSGMLNENKLSYLVSDSGNEFLFLLSKSGLGAAELQSLTDAVRSSVGRYFDIPVSAVTSRIFHDIRSAPDICMDLHVKAEQLFYLEESVIVQASDTDLRKVNIFSIKKSYEQQLISHMDQEEEERALTVIEQTEAFFRENTARTVEVKLFYSNMISTILERYHHCFGEGDEPADYAGYHHRIMAITRIRNIVTLFREIISRVIRNIKAYRLDNSNHIIKKAIDYIEKNYDKEISLQSLSAYLNLSKHYVCYLFKKETGDNISLYVNKVRIEKAKRLVLETNCKIKEIYDRLGYSDQQYFCKIFKKITGMTVMQYRDSVLNRTIGGE